MKLGLKEIFIGSTFLCHSKHARARFPHSDVGSVEDKWSSLPRCGPQFGVRIIAERLSVTVRVCSAMLLLMKSLGLLIAALVRYVPATGVQLPEVILAFYFCSAFVEACGDSDKGLEDIKVMLTKLIKEKKGGYKILLSGLRIALKRKRR